MSNLSQASLCRSLLNSAIVGLLIIWIPAFSPLGGTPRQKAEIPKADLVIPSLAAIVTEPGAPTPGTASITPKNGQGGALLLAVAGGLLLLRKRQLSIA